MQKDKDKAARQPKAKQVSKPALPKALDDFFKGATLKEGVFVESAAKNPGFCTYEAHAKRRFTKYAWKTNPYYKKPEKK